MTGDQIPSALVNPEAEAALLSSAMCNNEAIDHVVDLISPLDFGFELHARIWEALVRERNAGRYASPISIRGYFEDDPQMDAAGGVSYLAKLSGDATAMAFNPKHLAEQIRDLSTRRQVRSGLLRSADQCADLEHDVPAIVSAVDAVIRAPSDESARQASAGECMDDLIASFDEPRTGVTCGIINCLDDLWGSLRPGSMTILAARPGMGKTAVALTYARGAAQQGHGVQFFSHEMSGTDLSGRLAADMCFSLEPAERVPYSAIRDRDLRRDQRETIARASRHLHTLPFEIVDTGSITIGRLRAMVRSQKRRMAARGVSLDLVVVDYLQLVHPDRPMRSAYEAVSEVSRGLKAIAMDEQVAVVALAQLSRSVEQRADKRPILSDLRESGQIEQDADAVLFLLREEYYLQASEPHDDADKHTEWETKLDRCRGVIEFILAKRRNGSTGISHGRFYGVYQAVRGHE